MAFWGGEGASGMEKGAKQTITLGSPYMEEESPNIWL